MISKADLHVHTKYSFDGLSEPADIVKQAVKAGISVLAITDHNNIEGAIEAREAAAGLPLEVILGEEIYTGEGELLGVFLKDYIPPRAGLIETIDEIHKQGGLVIVPHPFNWTTLKETITVRKMRKIYERVDGIEIINASLWGRKARKKAPRLNEFYGLAEIGSSDAHFYPHVGYGYTYFPGKEPEDLFKAIIDRTTEAGASELWTPHEALWVVTQNIKKYGRKSLHGVKNTIKRKGKKS